MNVIYIVDYPVNGNSGKQKATREKSNALSNNDSIDKFIFISDKPRKGLFSKVFGKIFFDISTAARILPQKNFLVIQRVLFLPLTRVILYFKGIKVISEYHADLQEEIPLMNKSTLQKLLLKVAARFYNFNFHISHGIIYNHPFLKDKFDAIYKKPSIYSYNGSNYEEYYPLKQNIARKELQINPEASIFLFLGSVSQWHGVDYLIDAFNEEPLDNNQNIWLYIVGAKENEYTSHLKKNISNDRIIFVPPVDTKKANHYINASDFCLLPVKQVRTSPGSPLKLYDYISCGKPVITQENLPGYSDEVDNYSLGYSINFTNKISAAKDIYAVYERYDEVKSLFFLKNNRAIAKNKVSWERRMEAWCAFLESVR